MTVSTSVSRREGVTALAGAAWIAPHEPVIAPAGERPAHLLRASFTVAPGGGGLRLVATAHGVYEAFLNGVRVGDEELEPGFTAYRKRLEVRTYDVASLVREGENTLVFLLSDGWFRGRHGFQRRADGFGGATALVAAVVGDDAVLAATGAGWESRPSHVTRADLMDGQAVDLRLRDDAWFTGGGEGWAPVVEPDDALLADRARLVPAEGPRVRRTEEIAPVAIAIPRPGTAVIDLGQEINGWMRLTELGAAGTRLTLTHGEALDADGLVTLEHLRAFNFATRALLPAGQVDEVTSAGRPGDVFEPRHTTHGFRYVQVDGVPDGLSLDGALGVMVESDLERTGEFACSDPRLERLHEAVRWSLRGNACAVPTDCPQRERSGFTGDWQIFVAAGALLADVEDFSRRWLRDLAADQWADGRIPTVVPNPPGDRPSGDAFEDMSAGSAGWGDAAAIVPWELWRAYGSVDGLREALPAALAWVRYAAARAAAGRHPDRAAARPEAAPHERYLWDTGFHFGEWLEPDVPPRPDPAVDHGIVATAFLHRSAHLTALIAGIVGEHDAAVECRAVADGALEAWRAEYLRPDGTLTEERQAHYVRGLAFGLVPEGLRAASAARLAELIERAGGHLGTGFLATGQLLPALADHGQAALAHRLLLSTGHPSWLGMLDAGATAMWERWDAVTEDGAVHGSLNHYSKGAVVAFLHTHVAGLRLPAEPAPGEEAYNRVVIEPVPGALTWARSRQLTRRGTIEVEWRIADGRFELAVDLPAGTEAEIRLPDGAVHAVRGGAHTFACPDSR
ncbi:alpha-L-rhamnosidase [Demequina iriomotensis]|uniref:alpha-L-rhamnosidase n=1 Tax=Demequina iriomotensis TaxID=1536641 RepID=UPI000780CD76|nr:alpha-L-rhamnosidase [Demequina iriomotensis]